MIKIRGVKSTLNPKHLFANLKDNDGNIYMALFRFKEPIQENMVIKSDEKEEFFNFSILQKIEKPLKEDIVIKIETNKLSKQEFKEKYCLCCSSQTCGGIETPAAKFCNYALFEYFNQGDKK